MPAIHCAHTHIHIHRNNYKSTESFQSGEVNLLKISDMFERLNNIDWEEKKTYPDIKKTPKAVSGYWQFSFLWFLWHLNWRCQSCQSISPSTFVLTFNTIYLGMVDPHYVHCASSGISWIISWKDFMSNGVPTVSHTEQDRTISTTHSITHMKPDPH